jgi:hypothetical protein
MGNAKINKLLPDLILLKLKNASMGKRKTVAKIKAKG